MNRLGPRIAPEWPSLEPDAIIEAAAKKAKSDWYGPPEFRERLQHVVDAVRDEAELHWIGRVAVRQSLEGFLRGRFEVYRHRAKHPEIAGVPIEKPVFIVGLARTGTTILFNLLAQDPANRAPISWEVQYPDPPPEDASFQTDPRIKKNEKDVKQFVQIAPPIPSIHEVGAQLPQECMPFMAHTLLTPLPWWVCNIPGYQRWVDVQDAAPSYAYHRVFLEHLQSRYMEQRWVLKSPIHLATLDALLDEYPDARIIFTHRDPAKVVPSVASLFYTVGGIVTDELTPEKAGRDHLDWWGRAMNRAMDVRKAHPDKAHQFVDIQFEEIVEDPVAALRRAYDQFDMDWTSEAESRMRAFLADNPRGKHGAHKYTLDDFGLQLGEIRDRFDAYCRAYDVPLVM
jgi:hypothetical protein